MSTTKVYIIGVAPGGAGSLLPEARHRLQQADMVFAGRRLLALFPSLSGQKFVIENNLEEVAQLIKDNLNQQRIVVLASGDPNFYGIASFLMRKLGKNLIEIIPNVSALQLAFARIKESWDDAVLASVHSRPIADIVDLVRSHHKIALFTDDKNSPDKIARLLQEQGIANCRTYICQDLGSEKEKIIATDLYSLKEMRCSPLNVMILIKDDASEKAHSRHYFGIPDEEFQRRGGGLITKMEVRAVSLAKMQLKEDSIVWDIGAGSGAVSIEAAFLARQGKVFAIEKDTEAVVVIKENIEKFGSHNITVIETLAPANLAMLPPPTSVFIGGSGGHLMAILQITANRLKDSGRIVINAATLETLQEAIKGLKANGFISEVTLVNVARSQAILHLTRLEALNPVFIISGWRAKEPPAK